MKFSFTRFIKLILIILIGLNIAICFYWRSNPFKRYVEKEIASILFLDSVNITKSSITPLGLLGFNAKNISWETKTSESNQYAGVFNEFKIRFRFNINLTYSISASIKKDDLLFNLLYKAKIFKDLSLRKKDITLGKYSGLYTLDFKNVPFEFFYIILLNKFSATKDFLPLNDLLTSGKLKYLDKFPFDDKSPQGNFMVHFSSSNHKNELKASAFKATLKHGTLTISPTTITSPYGSLILHGNHKIENNLSELSIFGKVQGKNPIPLSYLKSCSNLEFKIIGSIHKPHCENNLQ
jgi:hypothetical protein